MRAKPWDVSEGLWEERIEPLLPKKPRRFRYPGHRRQTAHGSGLGRERWVVERTFAWLHNRRLLLLRTDRRHETHEALPTSPAA